MADGRPDDEPSGLFGKIKRSLDRHQDELLRRRLENTPFEYDDVPAMAENAKGESVTPERIGRIAKHLDRDEQPHYFNKGGTYFGLRIEGGNEEIRKGVKGKGPLGTFNNMAGNLLAATDKRVLIVSFQTTGDDVHSIPYDSIVGVDTAMGVPVKITIQTHGRTHHMEVGNEADDIREVADFIREQRDAAKDSGTPTDRDDPLEKLEKLADLKEKGVLTEAEFEEKKRDLLDEV